MSNIRPILNTVDVYNDACLVVSYLSQRDLTVARFGYIKLIQLWWLRKKISRG